MRLLGKSAIVLGVACAMALGSMTALDARNRGAWVAGVAGFAAGAAVGAVAANANASYYGPGYAYEPAYTYEPAYPVYSYDRNATAYTGNPALNPGYGYSRYNYDTNYTGPMRERQLNVLD